MRKFSIAVLVAVILLGLFFVAFHARRKPPQSITGIGVALAVRGQALEIMRVLPNTPAAKAGLYRGLIVQKIAGTDIVGKPLEECVAMTRGPVGSKVQLEIVDATKGETNIVEFTRENMSLPTGDGAIRAVPVAQ